MFLNTPPCVQITMWSIVCSVPIRTFVISVKDSMFYGNTLPIIQMGSDFSGHGGGV